MKKSCIAWLIGAMALAGCTGVENLLKSMVVAPGATIERDVRGHEQINSVQVILRLALKNKAQNANEDSYIVYDINQMETPIPLYQEINLNKNAEGDLTITSERKAFDVIKGKDFYYGLELKYYNVNGQLINHQFSGYDPKDLDNSTLPVHQHLFTLQNYALDKTPLVYPMTLDSIYYDRYLFRYDAGNSLIEASPISPSNIYVPVSGYVPNTLRYNLELAVRASEKAQTAGVTQPYTDPSSGVTYKLYRAIDAFAQNEMVPEVFNYEYRDTDPVEEILGERLEGYDDLGRLRNTTPVGRLRKKRSLDPGTPLDALGFKGILQFNKADVAFQMRICICHILTSTGKYDQYSNPGGVHAFNELSSAWNSFDIDYPVPFRVIADVDGDEESCIKGVLRFYPHAKREDIKRMFWGTDYFRNNVMSNFLM